MSVYESPQLGERFDLVLFMGVLYHLRHPLLALDLLHEHVVGDMLVFQSMLRGSAEVARVADRLSVLRRPSTSSEPAIRAMYFVEHKYAGDPTNWWIPNRACAEAMLRSAGFEIVDASGGRGVRLPQRCRRTVATHARRGAGAWLKR